jgi:ATP phosphoribosyltransferase regulatory subunit
VTQKPAESLAPSARLTEAPPAPDVGAPRVAGSALTPPAGMRDLLPPESRARRRVSEQLQAVFDRSGYELITTPLFEHVEVFERGLSMDPRDLVRFVEPDTGEVSALRPDITPQIARVVSTRLAEYPPPFRIRYEGTVIRRRRGRARRQRQIAQVGVELIGLGGATGDLEVIRLLSDACRAAGLAHFRIELSDVGVGRALLAEHGPELLALAADPLARKDQLQLSEVLDQARVPKSIRDRIFALTHLHGDVSVLAEARKLVKNAQAEAHLAALSQVVDGLVAQGMGPELGVDLGEIRGAAYYTGVSFALYADGPGEAVASGGRYDALLGRYGAPQPATGAGIDLENLLWALDHAGLAWREPSAVRFVVTGADGEAVQSLCSTLRARGVPAAALPDASIERAVEYARAWGYSAAISVQGEKARARRRDGSSEYEFTSSPGLSDIDALRNWAAVFKE